MVSVETELDELVEDSYHQFRQDTDLPNILFSAPQVWEAEKTALGNAWILVGHEGEIPQMGDYVIRKVLDDNFIVIRGEDETVRVLANSCRHQGNKLCRTSQGNASHFRCSYHGWTFNNKGNLVGVPFIERAYGDDLVREEWNIVPAPRYESHKGLIFVNLDPEADSLRSHLGEFDWYLDFYSGRVPTEEWEVKGPSRQRYHGNWKSCVLNMILSMEALEDEFDEVGEKRSVTAGPASMSLHSENVLQRYPDTFRKRHEQTLTEEQRTFLAQSGTPGSCIAFPNFGLGNFIEQPEPGRTVPFSFLWRVRPMGPDETEVMLWHLVERDAPEEFKKVSYDAFVFAFSGAGSFEVGSTHPHGADSLTHFQSETAVRADETWSNPGTSYEATLRDTAAEVFFENYFRHLRSASQ